MDASNLDTKYFIDEFVYNCPFCNRRNVAYQLVGRYRFNWTEEKECFVYFVQCRSCDNKSMHLTYTNIDVHNSRFYDIDEIIEEGKTFDDLFFYSVPTSFFALDSRIPKILRELITEAEGCLKSNFLTGASACARKVIYELAKLEEATGDNYEERIKSLKKTRSEIDSTYFDTLLTIQQVTSEKVHEDAYDGWQSKHLRLILSTLMEILTEIYVIPKVREEKRKGILDLKEEVLGTKTKGDATNESNEDKGEINGKKQK